MVKTTALLLLPTLVGSKDPVKNQRTLETRTFWPEFTKVFLPR
jgi:hypothetical protein